MFRATVFILISVFLFDFSNSFFMTKRIRDKLNNTKFEVNRAGMLSTFNNSDLTTYSYIGTSRSNVPDYFDWRDQGMVSPVKNQGVCGACWAFSVVANVESQLVIYLGVKETLSEQFLIDCDTLSPGCSSASIVDSFSYIISKFGGILRDADYYPFSQRQMSCRWNNHTPKPVPVIGYKRIHPDEKSMIKALFNLGPLSTAINSAAMDKYPVGNAIDEPTDQQCPPDQLDHAVLIVGYSAAKDENTGRLVPYWIIKNSWGTDWGDKGFYYLVRGRNACGVETDVSIAFVE